MFIIIPIAIFYRLQQVTRSCPHSRGVDYTWTWMPGGGYLWQSYQKLPSTTLKAHSPAALSKIIKVIFYFIDLTLVLIGSNLRREERWYLLAPTSNHRHASPRLFSSWLDNISVEETLVNLSLLSQLCIYPIVRQNLTEALNFNL